MKTALALLALLCAPAFAGTVTLTWTNPTLNVDGTAASLIGNNVYRGTKTDGSDLTLVKSFTAPIVTYTDLGVSPGQNCYAVTAIGVGSMESAKTGVVCKTVLAPAPNAPTGLTVGVTTAYQVLGTLDKFALLPVGTVPADTKCDATQSVNGMYAVPRASVSWFGSVKPQVVVAQCS